MVLVAITASATAKMDIIRVFLVMLTPVGAVNVSRTIIGSA
jgi:hypothetical protein